MKPTPTKKRKKQGWFYGIIRKTQRFGKRTEHYYEIHEIFPWGKNGKLLWTEQPITPSSDTINDLRWALSMMLADSFRMPIYEIRGDNLIERKKP